MAILLLDNLDQRGVNLYLGRLSEDLDADINAALVAQSKHDAFQSRQAPVNDATSLSPPQARVEVHPRISMRDPIHVSEFIFEPFLVRNMDYRRYAVCHQGLVTLLFRAAQEQIGWKQGEFYRGEPAVIPPPDSKQRQEVSNTATAEVIG